MQLICISRGSYSGGKELAERLAAKLGWACLSREELLTELANQREALFRLRVRRATGEAAAAGEFTRVRRDIARILEADPALAARVLRLANSALYAGRTEIKDLTHAIVRLGSSTVVSLVVGAAGQEVFRSDAPEAAAFLNDAWTS